MHSQLSHGVMVALQILVLPAVVRVHLGQLITVDYQQLTQTVFRKVFRFLRKILLIKEDSVKTVLFYFCYFSLKSSKGMLSKLLGIVSCNKYVSI